MFIASNTASRRRKGQGKTKGHEIVTKVAKDGKIALKFDEGRGT